MGAKMDNETIRKEYLLRLSRKSKGFVDKARAKGVENDAIGMALVLAGSKKCCAKYETIEESIDELNELIDAYDNGDEFLKKVFDVFEL